MTLPACDRIIELAEKATPCKHCEGRGWFFDTTYDRTGEQMPCSYCYGDGIIYPEEFRDESRTLAPKIALALNEAVRAIEDAPHGHHCAHAWDQPCTCWKRTALDRINELLTK